MDVTVWGFDLEIDAGPIEAEPAEIRRQIREYERGERRRFDLEVAIPETFTGRVMEAMTRIPFGETRSYGELATEIDSSPIAVGQACGRNPVPLIVPCHRVVGANSQGGFSAGGDRGDALKAALLDHERALRDEEQSQLTEYEDVR